jgi:hypothetical protein
MFCHNISVIFKSKMPVLMALVKINNRTLISCLIITLAISCIACLGDGPDRKRGLVSYQATDSVNQSETPDEYQQVNAILVLPKRPKPGETFRILATGGKNIRKARIIVSSPSGSLELLKSKTGNEMPLWRIDDFTGGSAGKYKAELFLSNKVISDLEFEISPVAETRPAGVVWKSLRGWDSRSESIYSAWINALFNDCDENASWPSLHEVTQNQNQNFLYNYLSMGEDDPDRKTTVIMQPDCADNPFFLRAYFAWKLGLPFGYHICDRGSLSHSPKTGQLITNEISSSKTDPVMAFNAFLRRVADGVHSGTARTALEDENSDYYPVPLEREALHPGIVFADPYGHTLVLVGRVPQTNDRPGLLFAVDAQPDGTVGIKRFWKGNFLFNTSGVVGEPGFKAFRPVYLNGGVQYPMRNKELAKAAGLIPFSLQQRKMESDIFYRTMERLINPKPLDPETALLGLIQALHEQLMVRVTSVANGEAYFKLHPGAVIPMPSSAAGIFQAGGQWEDFSTPNRDLRLLIAMDAVLGFPDLVARSPEDFNVSKLASAEQVRKKLQSVLEQKVSELSISYIRSNGSLQKLTVGEILKRRDAFEMAYNPNDGIEIRWGAPENSDERSTCRRHTPSNQLEKMRSVRTWFSKRLHPPT